MRRGAGKWLAAPQPKGRAQRLARLASRTVRQRVLAIMHKATKATDVDVVGRDPQHVAA
jgi:hypothetical protein